MTDNQLRQSSHQGTQDELPIRAATRSCRQKLRECISHAALCKEHWAENRSTDFNLWDSGIGASAGGLNCLDTRLRNDLPAQKVVLGALSTLAAWTMKCVQLAAITHPTQPPEHHSGSDSGSVDDRVAGALEDITLDQAKDAVEGLLKALVELEVAIRRAGTASRIRRADRTFSRHKHRYEELSGNLEFLLRVSGAPRRAHIVATQQSNLPAVDNTESRFAPTARSKPSHQNHDLLEQEALRNRANEIDVSLALDQLGGEKAPLRPEQQVLILANLRRTHRFWFYKGRQEQLRPRETPYPPQAVALTDNRQSRVLLPGIPAKSDDRYLQPSLQTIDQEIPPPARSQHSTGTTNQASDYTPHTSLEKANEGQSAGAAATVIALRADYPKPPKDKSRCPYCLIPLKGEADDIRSWKRHASEDLQPYTCYLPNCSQNHPLFNTFSAWKAHILSNDHRQFERWTCMFCQFSSKPTEEATFHDHIRNRHFDAIAHQSLDNFANICRRYIAPALSRCPVCSTYEHDWKLQKDYDSKFDIGVESFLEHVGQCLHYFALKILPDTEPEKSRGLSDLNLTDITPSKDRSWPSCYLHVSHHTGTGLTKEDVQVIVKPSRQDQIENIRRIQAWVEQSENTDDPNSLEEVLQLNSVGDNSKLINVNTKSTGASETFSTQSVQADAYEVACLCALPIELTPIEAMLDEVYGNLSRDKNEYLLGRIGIHKVVVMRMFEIGKNTAAERITQLLNDFSSIKFVLSVGIGGGVPGIVDVRLGDVVVSLPADNPHMVVQYDISRRTGGDRFQVTGFMNDPPTAVMDLLAEMKDERRYSKYVTETLDKLPNLQEYSFPSTERDQLFVDSYTHQDGPTCANCDANQTVSRAQRPDKDPRIHYDTIGSSDRVLKNAGLRNELQRELNVLCTEISASGLPTDLPCILIRGICDYSDSHKDKVWQPYAAAVAAAYMKVLLLRINLGRMAQMERAVDSMTSRPIFGLHLEEAPLMHSDLFVGRRSQLKEMDKALKNHNTVILGGLGGIGKTQLAIAYARIYASAYDSVFWFDANSVAGLKQSLRWTAQHVLWHLQPKSLTDLQIQDELLRWLSQPRNTRWLLIFDGYDDPRNLDIRKYYPADTSGRIIITTRLPRRCYGYQILVPPMESTAEGLEILENRSKGANTQADLFASSLVQRMDGLPLALATAGFHLQRSNLTCTQYLREYENGTYVNLKPPVRLPEYPDRSLNTTWDKSYQKLQAENAEAAQFLKLLAYFGHKEIHFALFHECVIEIFPKSLQPVIEESSKFEAVMRVLSEYCFVDAHFDIPSYSMHICVHDWALANLNQQPSPESYWFAFRCVGTFVVDVSVGYLGQHELAWLVPHAVRLLHPHFDAIGSSIPPELLQMADSIAIFMREQKQSDQAEVMYLRIMGQKGMISRSEHASTLTKVIELGDKYRDDDDLERAETLYREALARYEKTAGSDGIPTLKTIHKLGLVYDEDGRLEEAEHMYRRAFAGFEKALGRNHISTLAPLHNLGYLYYKQGKFTEAEQIYLQALAGYERIYGEEHQETLFVVHNLGCLYRDQGRVQESAAMFQRSIPSSRAEVVPETTQPRKWTDNVTDLFRRKGRKSKSSGVSQEDRSQK